MLRSIFLPARALSFPSRENFLSSEKKKSYVIKRSNVSHPIRETVLIDVVFISKVGKDWTRNMAFFFFFDERDQREKKERLVAKPR